MQDWDAKLSALGRSDSRRSRVIAMEPEESKISAWFRKLGKRKTGKPQPPPIEEGACACACVHVCGSNEYKRDTCMSSIVRKCGAEREVR